MSEKKKTRTRKKIIKEMKDHVDNLSTEAMNAALIKRKECIKKAQDIVMRLIEPDVDKMWMLENLHYINQAHLEDVVEERHLLLVCGYPLCDSPLASVPKQTYMISTKTNRVYNIEERKKYCSSLCYKASKYLKDQLYTSPLWLREFESSLQFKLYEGKSSRGKQGEEIDIGITEKISTEERDENSQSSVCSKLEDRVDEQEEEKKNEEEVVVAISEKKKTKKVHFDDNSILRKAVHKKKSEEENRIPEKVELKKESIEENGVSEKLECKKDFKEEGISEKLQSKEESKEESSISEKVECKKESKEKEIEKFCEGKELERMHLKEEIEKSSSAAPAVSRYEGVKCEKVKVTKRNEKKPKRREEEKSLHEIIMDIEAKVKSWMTVRTLTFLLGKDYVEALFREVGRSIPEEATKERVPEAEEMVRKAEEAVQRVERGEEEGEREAERARKPVPSWEELKAEEAELQVKVAQFYRGDKVVRFREEAETEEGNAPVMPNYLDHQSVHLTRASILTHTLTTHLPDVQDLLGLTGVDLKAQLKEFVSTLTLTASNILFRTSEHPIVCLMVIKLLSLRDKLLKERCNSNTYRRNLATLLGMFELDPAYMNRLVSYLTEIGPFLSPPLN